MRIQPVDVEPPSRLVKSRLRRLFDRPFSTVLKPSSADKPPLVDHRFKEDVDPTSLSLANMVRSYMEDTNDRPPRGRTTCNCFHRTGDASSDDEFNALSSQVSSIDVLKSFLPCSTAGEMDVFADVTEAVEKLKNQQQRKSDLRKIVAVELSSIGYDSSVCKTKWDENSSIPAGEYEYIEVIVGEERLVVDIDFRSEFEIARSTEEYTALLQTLPLIFVGSTGRLDLILGLMSEAAKQSLKKKGMMCPPWRKAEYMRAKWLSSHSRQTDPKINEQPPRRNPQFDLIFTERSNFKSSDQMLMLNHGSRRSTGLAALLRDKT